ncbi:tyrosine-type recombinase/integrase [Hydrogenophaga sp.]|uniref:tyrosine-type recombinase/integrase n=1 Tax=Hydrogenophaga sp. TaxID=1904254 RepID=UPI0035B08190
MQRRIRFTRKVIDALPPCPASHGSSEIEYTSEEAPPGLRLVVTKRGMKSWLFRYVMPNPTGPGTKRAIKVGVHPGMEPAEAIRVCLELRAQIAAGIDPQQMKQDAAQEITLDTFFKEEYWVSAKLLRSADDVESRWRLHISPTFGKLRFRDLKTADIVRFHDAKRVELCAATSNRLLALLKRVINVAIMHEHCDRNPCRGIRMHPEENIRDRTLSGEELRRFINALAQEPARVAADFFMFALATAARREECLRMTWAEVFIDEGIWRLPVSRAKSKKSRVIPLNEVALQVLASRAEGGKGVYVFEGKDGKPLSNPSRAWKRVITRAGITDLKVHDLRRSAATLLINHGGNMTQASNLLGHAPGSTLTATRYAFLGNEQLRDAAQRLSSVLTAASVNSPTSS